MERGLGCFGIFRESSSIINAHGAHFFKLAAALLLPLSSLTVFTLFSVGKISQQQMLLATSFSTREFLHSNDRLHVSHVSAASSFLFFSAPTAIVLLYLVSTIAFAQSVCRGYIHRNLTFKSSLSPVRETLRGLLLTALCMWVVIIVFFFIGITILTFMSILLKDQKVNPTILLVCIFYVTLGVLVYLTVVWSLAYVTSTLEEKWGWEAMRRSAHLIKGQRWLAFLLWLVFTILGFCASPGFLYTVHEDRNEGISAMILLKLLLLVIGLTPVYMYQIATTTVFYISCKIYHNESLDAIPCLRRPYGESDFANYMDLKFVGTEVAER